MLEYWLITKPTEEDNIVLDIRNMHLETSFDCSYDKLTIYDGKYFFISCGTLANSEGPDKMPHDLAFHQSLHGLLRQNRSSEKIYKTFRLSRHNKI